MNSLTKVICNLKSGKRIITPVLLVLAAISFTSCATLISGTHQKVELFSVPDSSTVWLNGKNTRLATPCTIKVKRKLKPSLYNAKNEQNYIFKKEGYYDFEVQSRGTFNPVVIGNAGFVVPMGVGWARSDYSEGRILTPNVYAVGAIATPIVGGGIDYLSGSTVKYEKRIFASLKSIPGYSDEDTPDEISFPPSNITSSNKGLALCIGNGMYETTGILKNPENDVKDIALALQRLGFEVMKIENADQATLRRAIDDFGRKLKGYDVGLFFYAGHGLQAKGFNYLVPVDAEIHSENDAEYNCVHAGRVLAKMEDAGSTTNIVIMDACRNNPFERSWTRSATGRGLAVMNAPIGSLIGFATSPGSVASDGVADNGLYTSALLEYMNEPGLTILEMFQKVRRKVREASNGEQVPWESTSLEGNFYFIEQ